MTDNTQKISLKDTLKSLDTEEHIDLWFYRPIGYRVALISAKLGITPNAITIASIFIGIAAGIAFYYNSLWINVIGMFLLIWANSFDSADGQLARMTKQYSRIGRILDGLSGDLWFITIYFAICFREQAFDNWSWWIWVLASAAGYFHANQASMADYYRNFHLYFLKGKDGSELDESKKLISDWKELSWSSNFMKKLTMAFYINYTKGQERTTPAMQKLRAAIHSHYKDELPTWLREEFRAKSLPLMKYTNMLSFNTRVIALFISLFIGMPYLYFIFELTVLNIMLIYMICKHESICRKFTEKINAE